MTFRRLFAGARSFLRVRSIFCAHRNLRTRIHPSLVPASRRRGGGKYDASSSLIEKKPGGRMVASLIVDHFIDYRRLP